MIKHNNISDINDKTDEGKLLVMALAALTSVQIESGKWGGMTHPDVALQQIVDIANSIYFTEEYKKYQQSIQRDRKINQILKDEE